MMKKYLNTLEYSSEVIADKEVMQMIEDNAGFVLPDLFVEDAARRQPIGSISTKTANENKFKELRDNKYLIAGNYGNMQLAMDTTMLTSHLLEDALNKDCRYSFHSSAISDGKDIIIIGGSASSGKTSTSLSVCLKEPEKIKIYSGDRTVIEDLRAIAGTKQLCVRLGSMVYEMPELKQFVPNCNDSPWDTTTIVKAEGIKLHTNYGPKNIKYFIYPRKGDHCLEVSPIRDDRAILRLHEDIRAFSDVYPNVMLGQKRILPESTLTHEDKQKRLEYAVSLAKEIPIISVSGKLDDIGKYVASLMMGDKNG